MPKFTFPDGRWVVLRPMYVLDELAWDDLTTLGDELEAAQARIPEIQERLKGAETDDEKSAAIEAAAETMAAYQKAYMTQLRTVYERMRDACSETSWGGELGARVKADELAQLSRRWRVAAEDEALPPV